MTRLELELRALAAHVDLPAERDLVPGVRAGLGARRPHPSLLAVSFALVVVAVAVAFAVPPARSAILRWLGLGTVRVEFVDKLPNVRTRRPLDLGRRLSLGQARKEVRYHVVTSRPLGPADEVHLRGDQVGFVYGKHKLVVLQSEGTFFVKEVGPGTHVQHLYVNGGPALWIAGAAHFVGYIGGNGPNARPAPLYLAGNVLIWERGSLTLRLEGRLSRTQAVRIARSFR